MEGMDGIGGGGGLGGVGSIGGASDVGGRAGPDLGAVGRAADGVGSVEGAAGRVGGGLGDGFDKGSPTLEAGMSTGERGGVKDGDWLHDPRQMTPDQAKDLEKMLDGPLHPSTKEDIKQFLDDYKNGTDRLFPDDPNPGRFSPINRGAPGIG